jgi:hypothetical protein
LKPSALSLVRTSASARPVIEETGTREVQMMVELEKSKSRRDASGNPHPSCSLDSAFFEVADLAVSQKGRVAVRQVDVISIRS